MYYLLKENLLNLFIKGKLCFKNVFAFMCQFVVSSFLILLWGANSRRSSSHQQGELFPSRYTGCGEAVTLNRTFCRNRVS